MKRTLRIITGAVGLLVLTAPTAYARLAYWRCAKPPDACIALTEADKENCPECEDWVKVFLDFSVVLKNARKEQQAAGVTTEHVASNFFLDAASEKIYGVDLTTTAGAPPKTSQIYDNPERYGLTVVPAAKVKAGTLAVVGDVAGVVTEKNGTLQITYLSARTGAMRTIAPKTLAKAAKEPVKYLAPTPQRE